MYNEVDSHSYLQSFNTRQYGISTSLTSESYQHRVTYDAVQRDTLPSHRVPDQQLLHSGIYTGPSVSILQSLTSSLKSSVKYTYTNTNTLNNMFMPTRGTYIQTSSELAGLGGDVKYVKNELDLKHHIPINSSISCGISLLAGMIQPLTPYINTIQKYTNNISNGSTAQPFQRTHLVDRFLLGGPLLLKGFKSGGVGPRDNLDALGGDIFTGLSISINSELPFNWCKQYNIHTQAFINTGNLISLPSTNNTHTTITQQLQQYMSTSRVSAGVGLVAPSPLGRVEVNFAVPLRSQQNDQIQKFGYGVAIKFL